MALGLELNTDRFVNLLTKLIGETEHLQDNPPKFVPKEDRLVNNIIIKLSPNSLGYIYIYI